MVCVPYLVSPNCLTQRRHGGWGFSFISCHSGLGSSGGFRFSSHRRSLLQSRVIHRIACLLLFVGSGRCQFSCHPVDVRNNGLPADKSERRRRCRRFDHRSPCLAACVLPRCCPVRWLVHGVPSHRVSVERGEPFSAETSTAAVHRSPYARNRHFNACFSLAAAGILCGTDSRVIANRWRVMLWPPRERVR